jgi:small subunit ribosomal protein S17
MSKSLKKTRGIVISRSGNKTVKVSVETRRSHPFYKKVVRVTWSALMHDEHNQYSVGDSVYFVSCRPLSAKKKWRVVGMVAA